MDNQPKKETAKAITGFIIMGLIFVGLYFYSGNLTHFLFVQNPAKNAVSNMNMIPMQEVKNLGYDFTLGQIDSSDNLTDTLKNQVTKIVYDSHFPESILKNLPIIIVNNLAITGNQYIPVSGGALKVPDLKPDWLSEGGFYGTFDSGNAVIFINKPIIAQGELTEVLTHELGHAIGSKLTDADWKKFYQLRNIPTATPRQGTGWNLSPQEDFAEVYKNTFTGIAVRTFYGTLIKALPFPEIACGDIHKAAYDAYSKATGADDFSAQADFVDNSNKVEAALSNNAQLQACRRKVLANQSQYTSDWQYGTPYKASVSQATKDFIVSIANRLNK